MTYEGDEEPTKPDAKDAHAVLLARLYGELAPLDRKRLAKLVEAWYVASLEQRILIEAIAMEFVKRPPV